MASTDNPEIKVWLSPESRGWIGNQWVWWRDMGPMSYPARVVWNPQIEPEVQEDKMQMTIWDVTVYDAETGEIIQHTRVSARSRDLVLTLAALFTETETGLVEGQYEAYIFSVATVTLREPRAKAEKDEG